MVIHNNSQKTTKKLRGKKKQMIDALKAQMGIVTAAANQVGIARRTHYLWLDTDEVYREAVNEIPDITLDFAENALLRQIREGNTACTIFYLKTKGKHRGYIEKQEIEHSGNQEGFKLIIHRPNEKNRVDSKPKTK